MVPGITSVSASDAASITRAIPPAVPPQVPAAAQQAPKPEPADKYQAVRVGPVFDVASGDSRAEAQRDSQRGALDAATQKAASERSADNRVLQQKLYSQF